MLNFDMFIGIDWSGAKAPVHTKSISVAQCKSGNNAPQSVYAEHNRHWSRQDVAQHILNINTDRRVFIGIDANLGYAHQVGAEQLGADYKAQDLWDAVNVINVNHENFFAENFWQNYPEYFWTQGKQPEHITLPKRTIETVCGEAGLGWPESPFKLIGPKQVGKGGLSAMRMVHYLKQKLRDKICIWPFEKHIEDTAQIVLSEIYPRQFLQRSNHGNSKINTIEDLNIALKYFNSAPLKSAQILSDHDTDALVSAAGLRWLCGQGDIVPNAISNPKNMGQREASCEGWIFGVT